MQLYQAGRLSEADAACRQLLARDSGNLPGLHLGGLIALQRGDARASVDLLSRAIAGNGGIADLHSHIAEPLERLGRVDEAIAHYRLAVSLEPANLDAWYNCGNLLLRLGRHDEALACYARALMIAPNFADAIHNHGNALFGLKRFAEALASYDSALALKPYLVSAWVNRANLLLQLNRPDEALASFARALAIRPDFVRALNDRGNALSNLGRYDEASRDFERLLVLAPDYDYARGALMACRRYCCDWRDADLALATLADAIAAGKRVAVPYLSLFVSESPALQQPCAQIYGADKHPPSPTPLWSGEVYRHDRIRIGYLSADFYQHATAYLMIGLFEGHDRSRFETTAIAFGAAPQDAMRRRLQMAFSRFVDVQDRDDGDVARLLRKLEIDIAIDLKGYSQHARPGIFAHRPAPIQVSFLGYPGTMGVDYFDYLIADRTLIHQDEHKYYQEKIVYLPHCYQPNDTNRLIPPQALTRVAVGLPETAFVFCCFNQHYKITPAIFDVWMRLLQQVEGSVLWLLDGDPAALTNLRHEAESRGIAASRLVFAPRTNQEMHLARHGLADLFIDTMPYNAHTTASDALWAGLPLVTCTGGSFASRVATSLLKAVGLPELAAANLDEYEKLALKLATDRTMLATIAARLMMLRRTSRLFDTARFCRDIENAYETMSSRYRRGEAPESFAVDAGP